MNEEIDDGAILFQKEVPIFDWDTSLNVYERVQQAEMELLNLHFCDLVFGVYSQEVLEDKGNYNGIQDFKNLCELNLNHVGTLKEHINLLRALSHGHFNNAFFINQDNVKVFVSINLSKVSN